MTTVYNKLLDIGFTENQASVYLELYKLNTARAGEIIKKTFLHRNIVYTCLEQLINKKLITKLMSKGVWEYKILPVSRLLDEVENKIEISKNIIEELSTLHKSNQQIITVYEGIQEFRNYENNLYRNLKSGSEIYYLGISPVWYEIIGSEVLDICIGNIKKKKIQIKSVTGKISNADKNISKKLAKNIILKINKLVATDTTAIEITDNFISIKSFTEPYSIIKIENKELARNYINYFKFLWVNSDLY